MYTLRCYIVNMTNREITRWESELTKSRRLNPEGAEKRIAKRVTDYLCSRAIGRPFGQTSEQYNLDHPELIELREWKDRL